MGPQEGGTGPKQKKKAWRAKIESCRPLFDFQVMWCSDVSSKGLRHSLWPCSLYPTWNLFWDGATMPSTFLHKCSKFMMLLTSWSFHWSFDIILHSFREHLFSRCLQGSWPCIPLSGLLTSQTQPLLLNSGGGLLIPYLLCSTCLQDQLCTGNTTGLCQPEQCLRTPEAVVSGGKYDWAWGNIPRGPTE